MGWQKVPHQINQELLKEALDKGMEECLAHFLAGFEWIGKAGLSSFLAKNRRELLDPFLLNDMEKSVQRVMKAIDDGESIYIYGDFDVDGLTGSAVLYWGLRKAGLKSTPQVYIPDRFSEGHGMNSEALKKIVDSGASILITADCGMGNANEIQSAKDYGIDVIITDHHLPEVEIQSAFGVINPKLGDYPFEFLSGAGVAFKFVQALLSMKFGEDSEEYKSTIDNCIDYVAIGTVADVVPLEGENRILVGWGLQHMMNSKLPFIKELWKSKFLKEHLGEVFCEQHIGYYMAPRLNAASRLETGRHAFEFLTSVKKSDVERRGAYLEHLNSQRRKLVEELKSAPDLKHIQIENLPLLVVDTFSTHRGLLGLLASHFVDHTPGIDAAIVLGRTPDGKVCGSARANGGLHLHETLGKVQLHLIQFGGHAQAAGLLLEESQLQSLIDALNQLDYQGHAKEELIQYYHCSLDSSQISEKLLLQIQELGPFGQNFPRPVFRIERPEVLRPKRIGRDGGDLSFELRGSEDIIVAGVGFRLGDEKDMIRNCSALIGDLQFNYFGYRRPQFRLKSVIYD